MTDIYSNLATNLKSRDYYTALNQLRDELGLPASTSHAEIEALLIFQINNVFTKSIKADIALMALGLLNGFNRPQNRTESKDESRLYSNRRTCFLKNTNYIEITSRGNFHSYDEAANTIRWMDKNGKPNTELDTICGTLDSNASRYLKKIVSLLYKNKEHISKYIKAAKNDCEKRVGHIIKWAECKRIPDEILPSVCFVKWIEHQDANFKHSTKHIDEDFTGKTDEGSCFTHLKNWINENSNIITIGLHILMVLLLSIIAFSVVVLAFFKDASPSNPVPSNPPTNPVSGYIETTI